MTYVYTSQRGIWNIEVTYVMFILVGVVSSYDVISAIFPGQTVLVTPIIARNKSRALQPVAKVAACFQELHVVLHTNIAQEFGKSPMDLRGSLGEYNTVTLVCYKFGPPKGVVSLYFQPRYLAERV